MPKLTRSQRSYWPPPVYVAHLADGSERRMSFWSREGKPLDFERGRRIVAACHETDWDEANRTWERGPDGAWRARWGKRPHRSRFAMWSLAVDNCRGHYAGTFRLVYRMIADTSEPDNPIVGGYVEFNGERLPDPYFDRSARNSQKSQTKKRKVRAAATQTTRPDLGELLRLLIMGAEVRVENGAEVVVGLDAETFRRAQQLVAA